MASKAALIDEMMAEEAHIRRAKRKHATLNTVLPPTPPSSSKKQRSQSDKAIDSPTLKFNFNGRVYRSGHLSPARTGKRKYAHPTQLLGAPDEYVIDAAYEAVAPKLQAPPVLFPAAKSDSDSDLEIDRSSPFASPLQPKRLCNTVPRSFSTDTHINPLDVHLPPHYASFITLHAALERALMMHLSTEGKGGRVAAAVAQAFKTGEAQGTTLVSLPNLITFHQLRPLIEQTGGLRFSEAHFARLAWLWSDHTKPVSSSVNGLGFIVTKAVNRTRSSGKKANSWGLGIEIQVRRQEEVTLSLVSLDGSPQSPKTSRTAVGNARDAMSVVALWSLGAEARKEAVRRKLGLLVIGHYQDSIKTEPASSSTHSPVTPNFPNGQLPTPPRSRHKGKHAETPTDESKFNLDRIPEVPAISLPALKSPEEVKAAVALLNEAEQAAEATSHIPTPAPNTKVSTAQRQNSLIERIRAKERAQAAASAQVTAPPSLSMKTPKGALERERQRMAAFKRKSMLSRLPDVADAVSMLFGQVACPPSPSRSPAPIRARRAVALDDVCTLVAKSSKISLSINEASEAVKLLCECCPDFATIKQIDGREWLCAADKAVSLRECKEALRLELGKDASA